MLEVSTDQAIKDAMQRAHLERSKAVVGFFAWLGSFARKEPTCQGIGARKPANTVNPNPDARSTSSVL